MQFERGGLSESNRVANAAHQRGLGSAQGALVPWVGCVESCESEIGIKGGGRVDNEVQVPIHNITGRVQRNPWIRRGAFSRRPGQCHRAITQRKSKHPRSAIFPWRTR